MEVSPDTFHSLVEQAFEELPDELVDGIDNLIIVVEDEPEDGSETLGYYDGIALTDRDTNYATGFLPDRIVVFRGPLTRMCDDMDTLVDEIRITLVHELAHFHGIEEDRLHELGWG